MLKKRITKIFLIFIVGVLFLLICGCKKDHGPDFVSDIDGNKYGTVTIGDQVWMNANLKTTRYNDGTEIPNVTGDTDWYNLSTDAYCWHNNDILNINPFGALYNWYAVNTGKLCPSGWHVASDQDWFGLGFYLGGRAIAGGKLKAVGTGYWFAPNTGATNETGFTAIPAGSRDVSELYDRAMFGIIGTGGMWWSSTEYSDKYLLSGAIQYTMINTSIVLSFSHTVKGNGFSIRCIKD